MPCDCGACDCKKCGPAQGYSQTPCEECGMAECECECEAPTPEEVEREELKRVVSIGLLLWGHELGGQHG